MESPPDHCPFRVQSNGTQLCQSGEGGIGRGRNMGAESVLVHGEFWRLEVAVELALPDAVHFRWTPLQRHCGRHDVFLLFLGRAHRADAPWIRFHYMGR